MSELPDFHDGYFDGLWLSENSARLFVRSVDQAAYTILLNELERLRFDDVRQGNIILQLTLVPTEQLDLDLIGEAYDVSASFEVPRLLNKAREKRLLAIEMSASYGAQGIALCQSFEIVRGHHILAFSRPS